MFVFKVTKKDLLSSYIHSILMKIRMIQTGFKELWNIEGKFSFGRKINPSNFNPPALIKNLIKPVFLVITIDMSTNTLINL